ncbi:hypothetical protein GCM10011399_23220 [Subtercola lobariae]|uniref:Uncharacterized protein n=1 Tax=Subtercola lobariae TaxID=1588641 RepID=A0A917B798_9MICO|nr:hypothetical protein GCM10011399_23220 [Subtercola lobariae]
MKLGVASVCNAGNAAPDIAPAKSARLVSSAAMMISVTMCMLPRAAPSGTRCELQRKIWLKCRGQLFRAPPELVIAHSMFGWPFGQIV